MVQVDSLTSWLRNHNVIPGQAHVDTLPGAVHTVQGGEDDSVEESGAGVGLAVVSYRVTDRQLIRTSGKVRSRGVIPAAWQTLTTVTILTVNCLSCGVSRTNTRQPNIAVTVPLTVRLYGNISQFGENHSSEKVARNVLFQLSFPCWERSQQYRMSWFKAVSSVRTP